MISNNDNNLRLAKTKDNVVMKVRALGFDFDASCVEDVRVLAVIEALSNEAMCLVESNEDAHKREEELASQLAIALEQIRQHRRRVNHQSFDSIRKDGSIGTHERIQALTMSLSQANDKVIKLQINLAEATSKLQQQETDQALSDTKQHTLLTSAAQTDENLIKLKDFSQLLEKGRDELVSRLKLQSNELERITALHTAEVERSTKLSEEVGKFEVERLEMRQRLESIDAERDELDSNLDEARISLEELTLKDKECQRKLAIAEKTIEQTTQRSRKLQSALSSRENVISQLEQKLKCVHTENTELKKLLDARNNDLGRAGEDMAAMTRESQTLSLESSRVVTELQATKSELNNALQKATQADHARRAAELEKSDLLVTYRSVVEERYAFEQGIEELTQERQALGMKMQQLHEENQRLKTTMGDMEKEIHRRALDAASFERQLDGVSRQTLSVQRKLEAAEAENRRLKDDLHLSRESACQISHHTHELQMASAKAQDDAITARAARETLTQERDALQKLFAEERQRSHGLEMLLGSLRAKDAEASRQLKRLAQENASLTTKMNEASSKLNQANQAQIILGNISTPSPTTPSTRNNAELSSAKVASAAKSDTHNLCLADYLNLSPE